MKKLDNLKRALVSLQTAYSYQEPYGPIELAGIVALFETCFELSWKAMKEALETYGYSDAQTGSPRGVLKTAYKAHMLDDENPWLAALSSRNEASHSYNQETALHIARDTKEMYYPMFEQLVEVLERDWA